MCTLICLLLLFRQVSHPKVLSQNLLRRYERKNHRLMLQFVHAHHQTYYHRDNGGFDTWIKVLVGGPMHVFCWSLADGLKYDMHDGERENLEALEQCERDFEVNKFRRMPSARLYTLNLGEVIIMPAGTFHYVYTEGSRVVIAGDYLDDSAVEVRLQSAHRDNQLGLTCDNHMNVEELLKKHSEETKCHSGKPIARGKNSFKHI